MCYVYVIRSAKNGKLYVGSSDNLKQRLVQHNGGKVTSTAPYRPWSLIYYEGHLSKLLARRTELFYKKSQGRRQLQKKLGLKEGSDNGIPPVLKTGARKGL